MLSRLAALLLLMLGAQFAAAADWPCFLGPTHDGIAPDTGLNKDWTVKPPKTLWSIALTDNGHAGPCAADGKVFIVDHRDKNDLIRALDFATGADLWSYPYPDAQQNHYGFTESTPLFHAGKIYTFSRMGKALCLDAAKGELIWSRDVFADFAGKYPEWNYAASPAIIDNKIILYPGGRGAATVALDAQTGKTIWQGAGDSKPSYSTPIIVTLNGQTQLIAFIAEGLIGIDPADGKRLWNFPWLVEHDQNTATPIVRGNNIFITSAWDKGSAMLDLSNNQPKVIWQNTEMRSRFQTPIISNGRIYGTQDPGKLVCLEAATGKVLWSKTNHEYSSTIAADGCIFVLEGKTGDLILLDAQTPEYKELCRMRPLPGPECWAPPIIADGRLLVRNTKSLVCLDLR